MTKTVSYSAILADLYKFLVPVVYLNAYSRNYKSEAQSKSDLSQNFNLVIKLSMLVDWLTKRKISQSTLSSSLSCKQGNEIMF